MPHVNNVPSSTRISYLEQGETNTPAMDVVASTVRSYYDVLTEYEKARKDLPTSVAINAQRAEGG